MPRRTFIPIVLTVILLLLSDGRTAIAQPKTSAADLSLEELLNVEVTSVSKQPQRLYDAPAAIYVISNEDIRRSGVTSIPEALRLAPGILVARVNSNAWAVSARGFNGRYANKLLVLQDGRTLYNPIFSGVYWNTQDLLLEDVERIEVIRGPVAALWGANAVNGVINIITKRAGDTQGTLVSVVAGNEERYILSARQGFSLTPDSHLRLYAKGFERDSSRDAFGRENVDDWRMQRGGFRLDWTAEGLDQVTWQGDIYHGFAGEKFNLPTLDPPFVDSVVDDTELNGGNLLARWQHNFSAESNLALQLYYDRARNSDAVSGQNRTTWDLDFQYQLPRFGSHHLLWGAGYRRNRDRSESGQIISFFPSELETDLYTGFIQDEWTLREDRLRLVLGSQAEHNDFSGLEIQPTLRLIWTPQPYQTIWTAVSRAVRTPSRAETGIIFLQPTIPPADPNGTLTPANPLDDIPLIPALVGSPGFDAEKVWSLEVGGRWRPSADLFLDLSLFYSKYQDLLSADLAPASVPLGPQILPLVANNDLRARSFGAELAVDWVALPWWKFQTNYCYLQILAELDSPDSFQGFKDATAAFPHHQFSLRSSMDLTRDLEFDLWLRVVGRLNTGGVDGYESLNLRLDWNPLAAFHVELVGQNLLDPQHPEFVSEFLAAAPVETDRSIFLRLSWAH